MVQYHSLYRVCAEYVHQTQTAPRVAPDEILAAKVEAPPLIPVVPRDDIPELPEADLLEALHYYISMMYPERKFNFDETALIALGMLMEEMVDETLNDESYKLFLKTNTKKNNNSDTTHYKRPKTNE
jgi:hypothetical protein